MVYKKNVLSMAFTLIMLNSCHKLNEFSETNSKLNLGNETKNLGSNETDSAQREKGTLLLQATFVRDTFLTHPKKMQVAYLAWESCRKLKLPGSTCHKKYVQFNDLRGDLWVAFRQYDRVGKKAEKLGVYNEIKDILPQAHERDVIKITLDHNGRRTYNVCVTYSESEYNDQKLGYHYKIERFGEEYVLRVIGKKATYSFPTEYFFTKDFDTEKGAESFEYLDELNGNQVLAFRSVIPKQEVDAKETVTQAGEAEELNNTVSKEKPPTETKVLVKYHRDTDQFFVVHESLGVEKSFLISCTPQLMH